MLSCICIHGTRPAYVNDIDLQSVLVLALMQAPRQQFSSCTVTVFRPMLPLKPGYNSPLELDHYMHTGKHKYDHDVEEFIV